VKFKFFSGTSDFRVSFCIAVPNFIKIGQTIFVFFKMAVSAILDFQKFEILTVDPM